MKCRFEHEEDCCNSGSPQYMCKCKPKDCNSIVPMTNADRIRSMSDEEMAKFLCDFRTCDSSEHPCDGCKAEPNCHTGHSGMIDWLRHPVQEG